MKIEFFYFADCPSHEDGLKRLKKVCAEEGVDNRIELIEVASEEEAVKLNFIGSPTIRINGRDIDSQSLEGQRPALNCRVYFHPDGKFSPLPAEETIRDDLRREKKGKPR